jgi:O-antigen/teichoic acid export membrane protein
LSKPKLKQFKRDSFVYGAGTAFSKGFGFILLPIYTRLFTPIEYGLIEIVTMTNVFLSLVLNMGLDASQSFYFFRLKKEGGKQKQAQLVTAILQWRLSIGLLITVLAVGISPLLNTLLFDTELKLSVFAVSFAGTFFYQIAIQSAQVFQLLFRPWQFLGITFFQSISSAAITIGLMIWIGMGFQSYFIGFSIGALFSALVGWWMARDYVDWSASNIKLWPRIMKFGLPLVPANLLFYVLDTSDRWFLGFYHGGLAIGVYAVGVKITLAIGLVVEPFRKAWNPLAMKSLQQNDSHAFFSFMARLYMGVGVAAVVILTAFSSTLIKWVTLPTYHNAYKVVGLLAWKQLFYGFFVVSALGIYKKEKTKLIALISGLTSILNVTLLYFWVPKYAEVGAALAIVISFFVWNLFALAISYKLWPIHFPWAILLGQILMGLFATGILILSFDKGLGVLEISLFTGVSSAILLGSSVPFHHLKNWYKDVIIQGKMR